MTCLDDHEGYPKHYEKACIPVPINNQIVDAIVYTMTDSKKNSRQSSSGVSPEYIELIRNGLAENGLGETYLDDALLNLTNKSQE